MGMIRQNMEKLVSQVRGSASARHRAVADMRVAAHGLLAQDQREAEARRKRLAEMGHGLCAGLTKGREAQVRAARALKTGLERARELRRTGVREGCAATRGRLAHLHGERQRHGAEVKKVVRGEVAEIRAAVDQLRSGVQAAMNAIARDVAEAGRLWRKTGPARRK